MPLLPKKSLFFPSFFILILLFLIFPGSVKGQEVIAGDIDKDGDVDIFDYNILIENFGRTNCGNVADIDGTITKVDFLNGNTVLYSDTRAPYSYTWDNVGAGSYTLKARAYDNEGATTDSATATITVNPVGGSGDSWYVDNAATGSNTGASWANAWTSFLSIAWSSIQPGDTIYISGGTSSKTYSGNINVLASGTAGNPVTITKGVDPGHNGEVILQGSGSGYGVNIRPEDYIMVSGLSFQGWGKSIRISGSSGSTYSSEGAAKHIIIENNDILMDYGGGIGIQTSDHITIRNNYLETLNYVPTQTDGIYSQRNHDNVYEGNTIIINNQHTGGHDDGIQLYQDTDITVKGNYIEQHNDKSGNAQGIYATVMHGTSYYVNNVVNLRNAQSNALTFRRLPDSGGDGNVVIYGNTVYAIRPYHLIQATEVEDPVIKNNIGMVATTSLVPLEVKQWNGNPSNIENNLLWNPNTNNVANIGGSIKTQSQLESMGINIDGKRADPKFISIPDKDFHLQSSSPAIDAGKDLGSPYNVDKDGVPRPQGSAWDIGAYEYTSGTPMNNPPTVSLTFPQNGATYTAPATINMAATASDIDGNCKVDIFDYNILIENFGK